MQTHTVDRIQGASLDKGPSPDRSSVHIEWSAPDGPHQMRMGFLDAMYLLNLLKALQLQTGFRMPEDPRTS